MIKLYLTPGTRAGRVAWLLEELNIQYDLEVLPFTKEGLKSPEHRSRHALGRVPVIEDGNVSIFESGAIMIYLADKANNLISTDPQKRAKVLEWLMFQMGGIGPMMGQANVFFRYFPEKIQPAIDRYQNESRRLFEVLDSHLKANEWLAGEYSIADIANWCWVRTHKWSGVSTDGLKNLERWKNAMYEQPGMLEGIKVPVEIKINENLDDEEKTKEFIKNAQKMVKK